MNIIFTWEQDIKNNLWKDTERGLQGVDAKAWCRTKRTVWQARHRSSLWWYIDWDEQDKWLGCEGREVRLTPECVNYLERGECIQGADESTIQNITQGKLDINTLKIIIIK